MNLNDVKSNISDLAASTLDQVSETLQPVGKDVSRTASRLMKSDAVETVTDKASTLAKVIAAATSFKAIQSALNPERPFNWALGAMNLQRRPSTFGRILTGVGLVATGAAVGAGVALLLTPNNGEQNRAALRRTLEGLQRNATGLVEQAQTKAHEVVEQVENKAQDVAQNVEGASRGALADAREGLAGLQEQSSGGAPGARPRIPGMSHRAPKL